MDQSGVKAPRFSHNFIFCFVTVMFWFSMYAYQTNFTPYLYYIDATAAIVGLIVGSYGVTQLICRIPFGMFSDKLEMRKPFIIAGMFCTVLSAAMFCFTDSIVCALCARVFAGVAASFWVNFTVLYSSYFEHGKAVSAVGFLNVFNNIGQLISMSLGALLIHFIGTSNRGMDAGYNAAFLLALAGGIVGLAASFFIHEPKKQRQGKPPEAMARRLLEVARDPVLLSVSLIAVVSQLITFSTVFGFTPKYAEDVMQTTPLQNGILTVMTNLFAAAGAFIMSRKLSGRVREYKLVFIGMMLLALCTAVIPLTKSFFMLVFTQSVSGIGKGISFPLLMGLSIKHMPQEKRGTAMGFFQAVYGVGMFAGPFFTGIITSRLTLNASFIMLGGVCALAGAGSYFLLKKVCRIAE